MSDSFDQLHSYLAGGFSWEKLRQIRLLLFEHQGRFSILRDLKGIADREVSRWGTPVEAPLEAKPLERAIFDSLGKERFSFVTFDKGHLQPSICAPGWIHVTSWWLPELNSYVQRSSPEVERLVESLVLPPSQRVPVHRVATVIAQWYEGEPQVRAWVTSRPGFTDARAKLMGSSMGDFDFTVHQTEVSFGQKSFPKREVSLLETGLLAKWLDENPEKARVFQGEVANAWAMLPGHVAKEYSLEELCNALEEAGYRIPFIFIPEPEEETHADNTNS